MRRARHLVQVLPSVGHIAVEDEGSRINGRLEGALSRSQRRAILGSVLHAHGLDSLTSHRLGGRILSEELRVRHSRIIEGDMIVHGAVEVFSVRRMSRVVVLRALHIEVGDPAELTVNISIAGHARVVRHPGTLDLVHFIRVRLALRLEKDGLFCLEVLIEKLLVVRVVTLIEETRAMMMPLVPLFVRRSQHTIIGVLVHNHLDSGLSVGRIDRAHSSLLLEDARESVTSEWRLAIEGCNWRA